MSEDTLGAVKFTLYRDLKMVCMNLPKIDPAHQAPGPVGITAIELRAGTTVEVEMLEHIVHYFDAQGVMWQCQRTDFVEAVTALE